MDIEKCKEIVNYVMGFLHFANEADRQDMEQNLWLGLVQFEKNNGNINSDNSGLVYVILRNRLYDWYKSRVRKGRNRYLGPDFFSTDLLDGSMIFNHILAGDMFDKRILSRNQLHELDDPQKIFHGFELLNLIGEWVEKKDEMTKRFIRECLLPSKKVIKKWNSIIDKHPYSRCRKYLSIPPQTLATRILGMPKSKYYSITRKLYKFLHSNGYGIRNWKVKEFK